MAPNVTLHFFPANDLNGTVTYTVTDEDPVFRGLRLKLDRSALGGAELLLARRAGEDFSFPAEAFVRVIVAAYSTTTYYPWGFFLTKRLVTVIDRDEDGGEVYRFGGAGPKMYLDRGVLGIGGPLSGWNVDLGNGVWRWGDSATIGKILERIVAQDGNMDNPALPDLTLNFDETDDSASVAWTETSLGAGDAPYTIPIDQSLLRSLYDFEDLEELTSWVELGTVATPKFELNVTQGLGADYTGSAFGVGVCLLREGDNIANDGLEVEGHSIRKASHVIVEGADGAWVVAERPSFSPGDYVKYAKVDFPRTSQLNLLEKSGIRWLQRQDRGEQEYVIDLLPGDSDANGLYFPAPNRVLWLSNQVSLDTSAVGSTPTLLDIGPGTSQLVTGLELDLTTASDDSTDLKKARSWRVKVVLNRERPGTIAKTPDQKSATSGGGGCKCIRLCGGIACREIDTGPLDAVAVTNGDAENASGTEWTGGSGYSTSLKYAGSRSYTRTSATSCDISLALSGTFEAGVRYVLDCWLRGLSPVDHDTSTLSLGVSGSDEAIEVYVGGPGSDPVDLYLESDTGADGATWLRARVCWTPTADRTGVRFRYQDTAFASASFAVDEVTIHEGPADPDLVGTESTAARCDHRHIASDVDGLPSGGTIDFGETGDITTQAFGDSPAAGSTGEVADAGHLHGMPANPVTAHEAASDPHGQYIQAGGGGSLVGHPVSITGVGVPLTGGGTLAVSADRGDAIPIIIPEIMYLRGLAIRCTATSSGTVEWGLFDYSIDPTTCVKVAGGSGALSATGYFLLAATGAPVTVQPGNYMLIVKWPTTNRPTISTESTASTQAGSGMKTIGTYTWDDTPDLTTGWAGTSLVMIARLVGDLTGSGHQW